MSSVKKIQINVTVGEKPNPLFVAEDETLDRVCQLISEKFIPEVSAKNIKLVHAAQQFEYGLKHLDGKPKNMKHIEAGYLANFLVIIELHSGIFRQLQTTTSQDHPDVLTLENGPTTRTIMPCGHAIGKESMAHVIDAILNRGEYEFNCLACSFKWDWPLVKHVACLTDEEASQTESKLSNNYISKKFEIQACPSCGVMTTRSLPTEKIVKCLICTSMNGRPYLFCWECATAVTENLSGCECPANESQKLKILTECPDMKIYDFLVPSIRACPNCGLLLEQLYGCGRLICVRCEWDFCFVCLSKWHGTPVGCIRCILASRQTTIPCQLRV